MRLFRRHRGSQSEAPTPVVSRSGADVDPYAFAQEFVFTYLRSPVKPELLTARQSLTASLMRDETLAQEPDHVDTIVKSLLLDLADDGLTIVASGEVE